MARLDQQPAEVHNLLATFLHTADCQALSQTCTALQPVYRPLAWRWAVVFAGPHRTPLDASFCNHRRVPYGVFLNPDLHSWYQSTAVTYAVFVDRKTVFLKNPAVDFARYYPRLASIGMHLNFQYVEHLWTDPFWSAALAHGMHWQVFSTVTSSHHLRRFLDEPENAALTCRLYVEEHISSSMIADIPTDALASRTAQGHLFDNLSSLSLNACSDTMSFFYSNPAVFPSLRTLQHKLDLIYVYRGSRFIDCAATRVTFDMVAFVNALPCCTRLILSFSIADLAYPQSYNADTHTSLLADPAPSLPRITHIRMNASRYNQVNQDHALSASNWFFRFPNLKECVATGFPPETHLLFTETNPGIYASLTLLNLTSDFWGLSRIGGRRLLKTLPRLTALRRFGFKAHIAHQILPFPLRSLLQRALALEITGDFTPAAWQAMLYKNDTLDHILGYFGIDESDKNSVRLLLHQTLLDLFADPLRALSTLSNMNLVVAFGGTLYYLCFIEALYRALAAHPTLETVYLAMDPPRLLYPSIALHRYLTAPAHPNPLTAVLIHLQSTSDKLAPHWEIDAASPLGALFHGALPARTGYHARSRFDGEEYIYYALGQRHVEPWMCAGDATRWAVELDMMGFPRYTDALPF